MKFKSTVKQIEEKEKILFDRFPTSHHIPLDESTMQEIASYKLPDNYVKLFEMLYELEYKYFALRTWEFNGLERRKENIIKIIEDISERVIGKISKSLKHVFGDWLKKHAILSPRTWAEERVSDSEDVGEDSEISMFAGVFFEWAKYKFKGRTIKLDTHFGDFLHEVLDHIDQLPTVLSKVERDLGEEVKERAEMDLNDMDDDDELEDWNDTYGMDAETIDDAYEMTYKIEPDLYSMIDYYDDEKFQGILDRECLIELYQILVFPEWFGHWKKMGIVNTRETVEEVYKDLKKMDSQELQTKFKTINIAINTNHQTGSMVEYYEEKYKVDEDDFKRLSNLSVKPWNKELAEIGVKIKGA